MQCGILGIRFKGSMLANGLLILLLGSLVAGCATRAGPELLTSTSAPPDARLTQVVVATTRARAAPDVNIFTAERAQALNFAEFTIATPQAKNSDEAAPLGAADLSRSFVTVDQAVLTRADFSERVAPRGTGTRKQNVVIFAHGFNTNFQEALFRLVQMSTDARIDGKPVLFAWPSQGRATGYTADQESVALSRDDFAELLTILAANPGVGRITVVAHSLGGWLVVEALQKLRIAGKRQVINRLNVILVSPDIDVDTFRQQIEVIGPMSPPMTLLVATDDRALALSRRISGSSARVGALNVNNPRVKEAALRMRIRIVDISTVSSSSRFNHDRHVNLAALYPVLASSTTNDPGLERRTAGVFVLDALSATFGSPFTTANRAQNGH